MRDVSKQVFVDRFITRRLHLDTGRSFDVARESLPMFIIFDGRKMDRR